LVEGPGYDKQIFTVLPQLDRKDVRFGSAEEIKNSLMKKPSKLKRMEMSRSTRSTRFVGYAKTQPSARLHGVKSEVTPGELVLESVRARARRPTG
jgi:hypothetical protein